MERYKNKKEKITNALSGAMIVFLVFLIVSLRYDFYYELNDDMVIADILSGKYTGIPQAQTNQLLYPLGWLISGCYKLLPETSVYPIFLSLSIALSLWMISFRCLSLFQRIKTKIGCGFLLLSLSGILFVRQLVLIQYTAVSGILCATACFWVLTSETTDDNKKFWKQNYPAMLCFLLAFNLRSEMALLCLPMVGISGGGHWSESILGKKREQKELRKKKSWYALFEKQYLIRYPLLFCVILLFMGIFIMTDHFSYRSREWKKFREFFDARTRVYDYTWYPSYESEEEFYRQKGISEMQYQLIDNYNFGLDSSITADILDKIASYNEKERNSGGVWGKLKNTIKQLIMRPFSPIDFPYNIYIIIIYVLIIILAALQKRKKEYGIKLIFLLFARNISWFYLLWSERVVERITIPLYLIEFLILAAILVKELVDRPLWNIERYYRRGVVGIFFALSILLLPQIDKHLLQQCNLREITINSQEQLEIYTKAHPQDYYYLDVYSMVDFTAKIYDRDNEKRNYDFLGGWICNSPLQKKAIEAYIDMDKLKDIQPYFKEEKEISIAQVLLLDNFHVVARKNSDIEFLEKYYYQHKIPVNVVKIDQIEPDENPFVIYRVEIVEK